MPRVGGVISLCPDSSEHKKGSDVKKNVAQNVLLLAHLDVAIH